MTIIIVRGGSVKLSFPRVDTKPDGTIWINGSPLLGIEDPADKAKALKAVTAKRFGDIDPKYFTRMGENPNGLWAGTVEEWQKHPDKLKADEQAAVEKKEQEKIVTVYLSSRGWGDYSPCEWRGDITRPDNEILAECRHALDSGHDVDKHDQTDEQLLDLISKAKNKWISAPARKAAREKAEAEDIQRKIDSGFCFACETWCHGDCGHYSIDPMVKMRRDLKTAQAEENYGINEG